MALNFKQINIMCEGVFFGPQSAYNRCDRCDRSMEGYFFISFIFPRKCLEGALWSHYVTDIVSSNDVC